LPPLGPGCRRPTYRFSFAFDAVAAAAAEAYDGLSVRGWSFSAQVKAA